MKEMTVEEKRKEIEYLKEALFLEQEIKRVKSEFARARSVTVGNAGGGTIEISMRGDGGEHLWSLLNPAEVTELIHSLAGSIGCHIVLKPREDFASWRNWRPQEGGNLLAGPPTVDKELPKEIEMQQTQPMHSVHTLGTRKRIRRKQG